MPETSSGHMTHATVANATKTTSPTADTGGMLAQSSPARLTGLFPNSPLMGAAPVYTAVVVADLKGSLLRNTVTTELAIDGVIPVPVKTDLAMAQEYYGFPAPDSTGEPSQASGDLTFLGSPDITKVAIGGGDGNPGAYAYVPNLMPPDNMSPVSDNSTATATISFFGRKSSRPPFPGAASAGGPGQPAIFPLSPHESAAAMELNLVPVLGDGTEAGSKIYPMGRSLAAPTAPDPNEADIGLPDDPSFYHQGQVNE